MTDRAQHWDGVYRAKDEADLTWFEAEPQVSLDVIGRHVSPGQAIVDVGAGASRLADHLLAMGFGPLTALDLSGAALKVSQDRLGPQANDVTWVVGDVAHWRPETMFALWHDRAVFHFLTEPAARKAYFETLLGAVAPDGKVVITTFAEDGPEKCSGLPVRRYSPQSLRDEVNRCAPGVFTLLESRAHVHVTPTRNHQRFQVSVFQRNA